MTLQFIPLKAGKGLTEALSKLKDGKSICLYLNNPDSIYVIAKRLRIKVRRIKCMQDKQYIVRRIR